MGIDRHKDSSLPARTRRSTNENAGTQTTRCLLPSRHQDDFHHSSPLSVCLKCDRVQQLARDVYTHAGLLALSLGEGLDAGLHEERQWYQVARAILAQSRELSFLVDSGGDRVSEEADAISERTLSGAGGGSSG